MLTLGVADSYKNPLGSSVTSKLPDESHQMLRAALSNAIYRVLGETDLLRTRGLSHDIDCDNEIDDVVSIFWEEFAKPAPQMEHFIRHNQLRKTICLKEPRRMELLGHRYGPWISVGIAHRIFEQEVYEFSRSIGLSKEQATRHVIKARESSSRSNIDLLELGEYESNQCEDLLMYLSIRKPEVWASFKEPDGLRYVSEIGKAEIERRLVKSNPKGTKHVKRFFQTLKDNGPRSEYDEIITRFWFLGAEPFADNINGLREDNPNMETANETKIEGSARKDAKEAHKAELRTHEARWQAEKEKDQNSDDHQAGRHMFYRVSTSNSEPQSKSQPTRDPEKHPKSKEMGNKRKSEHELPVQSETPTKEHHKHKKSRVDNDSLDSNSGKNKRKKKGPQHSPFFHRTYDPEAKKKDAGKKAEQHPDFRLPMIQSA